MKDFKLPNRSTLYPCTSPFISRWAVPFPVLPNGIKKPLPMSSEYWQELAEEMQKIYNTPGFYQVAIPAAALNGTKLAIQYKIVADV